MVCRKIFPSIILLLLVVYTVACGTRYVSNCTLEAQGGAENGMYYCIGLGASTSGVKENAEEALEQVAQSELWQRLDDPRFNDKYSVGPEWSSWELRGIPLGVNSYDFQMWHTLLGSWVLGDMVGIPGIGGQDNYHHVGNVLTIDEARVVYNEFHINTKRVNDNPRFVFFFQDIWQFYSHVNRPNFEGLGFHNPFVIVMFIFEGDNFWMGPLYLRDWTSMIFNNGVYREFVRRE